MGLSGIVPVFNYPNYYAPTNTKDTYFINGLSVTVLSENAATGEVTVQVKFDDYEIRSSKRWSGYLSLSPNPSGSSLYALNIKNGATLNIIKAGSPNRHQLNTNNTPSDFINNTVFTSETGAYIHMESNAGLGIGGNSTFILKTGSVLELEDGAELVISKGELIIEDGAEIILHNGAKITINEDGILTNNNTIVGKGLSVGDNTISGNQAEVSVRGTLNFASNSFWTHDKAGFYKFYPTHTLNLPTVVPVTFTGLSKTHKMLVLAGDLTFNGHKVRLSNGLIDYVGGTKIKLNVNTDMEGLDLTLKGEVYLFNEVAIEVDNASNFKMTNCDFQDLGTGLSINNTTQPISLISCNYTNIRTGLSLDNVDEVKVLGGSFFGSYSGISIGVKAIDSRVVEILGANFQNFTKGGDFKEVSGAYYTNTILSNNDIGIYGEDVLLFLRTGTKIDSCSSIGVEMYGVYDYSSGNYNTMLTMGDVGCASVINSNSGIVGRDFLLNIDAQQHAINNGTPNYIIPNRFNDNANYTFEVCYNDKSVAPSQINAKGNFWGTNPSVIPLSGYKITANNQCITKPNHGQNIPLITTDYSTCEDNGACMSCFTGSNNQPGLARGSAATRALILNEFTTANNSFVIEDEIGTRSEFLDVSSIGLIKDTTNNYWDINTVSNVVYPIDEMSVQRIQVSKAIKNANSGLKARQEESPNDIFAGMDLNELDNLEKFTIFPNPAQNVLNVNVVGKDKYRYLITNVLGGFVIGGSFTESIQINTEKLKGIYFVEIIDSFGRNNVKKVVVNN